MDLDWEAMMAEARAMAAYHLFKMEVAMSAIVRLFKHIRRVERGSATYRS